LYAVQVTLRLGGEAVVLRVAGTAEFASHAFPIAGLANGIHDATVMLSGTLPDARGQITTQLRLILHRIAPPRAGSLVQVDYERRTLRVNRTRPFLVQGYYDVPGCGRNSSTPHGVCFNLSDIPNQARMGYTAVLYYNWMEASARQQRRALDTLAAHGMMLMLHITYLLEDIACGGTAGEPLSNCTKSASAEARAWAAVIGQIKQVRKTAKSAQKLGRLQPFIAVSPQKCMGQLAVFGPT
jgi:hypothetical protein